MAIRAAGRDGAKIFALRRGAPGRHGRRMSRDRSVTLCSPVPLPAGGDGVAPDWVHLVPAGDIATVDGRGPFRLENAGAVAAASMADGAPLALDENHAVDLAAPQGGPSPARGWIVEMQARADGLWGRVEWTAAGRALMADRAYRWISPAMLCDAGHRVLRVIRASLVNNPNLKGLAALNGVEGDTEPAMDPTKLREALGLPAGADEAAILAAATAAKSAADAAAATLSTHAAALAGIGAAVGAAQGADGEAVLAAVRAAVDPAKAPSAAEAAALRAELNSVATQLAAMQGAAARDRATAVVDAAIRAGRVGVKPLRDHYIARHMADPGAVETEFAALPALNAAAPALLAAPPAPGGDSLDAVEAQVVRLMGVDPKAFAATRNANAAQEIA